MVLSADHLPIPCSVPTGWKVWYQSTPGKVTTLTRQDLSTLKAEQQLDTPRWNHFLTQAQRVLDQTRYLDVAKPTRAIVRLCHPTFARPALAKPPVWMEDSARSNVALK